MTMAPTAGVHFQYAGRINCEKNGCPFPCEDDGLVYFLADKRMETIQGHAVDVLLRTVNFAPWIEDDPK